MTREEKENRGRGEEGPTHAPSLSTVTLIGDLSGRGFAGTVRSMVTSTVDFATLLDGPRGPGRALLSAACVETQADCEEERAAAGVELG